MRLKIALSVALLVAAAAPATADVADEIRSLIQGRDAEVAKGPQLREAIKEEEGVKAAKAKEKALWDNEMKDKILPQARILNQETKKLEADPDYQKHQKLTAAYKAKGCESPQSRPQYEQCLREKALLDALWVKPNVGPRYDSLKKERDALGKRIDAIEPRRKQLEREIAAFERSIKARRDSYELLRKNVERIEATLKRRCQSPEAQRSPEALKHCHSIDWDGARKNLPPLTEADIRPPFRTTPN